MYPNVIISRKNSSTLSLNQLYLLGDPLPRVECYKYLGLLISSIILWSMHITATCSKAKQILGLLYRCFYGSANPDTLKQLYCALRCSTEFCKTVIDLRTLNILYKEGIEF